MHQQDTHPAFSPLNEIQPRVFLRRTPAFSLVVSQAPRCQLSLTIPNAYPRPPPPVCSYRYVKPPRSDLSVQSSQAKGTNISELPPLRSRCDRVWYYFYSVGRRLFNNVSMRLDLLSIDAPTVFRASKNNAYDESEL